MEIEDTERLVTEIGAMRVCAGCYQLEIQRETTEAEDFIFSNPRGLRTFREHRSK